MKSLTIPLLLIFASVASSCNEDSVFAKYEGNWQGNYIGGDSGTWMVTINSDGSVSGTGISDSLPGFPFTFNGYVTESGQLNAQSTVVLGRIDFVGQITNDMASGEWRNIEAAIQGTWQGEKQ